MKINNMAGVLTACLIMLETAACMAQRDSVYHDYSSQYRFKSLQLIVPAPLIGAGVIGLESDWLKFQNREIRDEQQENIDRKFTVDDFTQYAPMVAAYGLNLCGIKGRHGYGDLTIILETAYALMGAGFFRMYNNRHWLTDVLAGAGIGILSVQAAYRLYPIVAKTFFYKCRHASMLLSPYVSSESKGLACRLTF